MFHCAPCNCLGEDDQIQLADVTEIAVGVLDQPTTKTGDVDVASILDQSASEEEFPETWKPKIDMGVSSCSNLNFALSEAALRGCYNNYLILIGEDANLLEMARTRLRQGLRLCIIDTEGIEPERLETVPGETLMHAWDPPPRESSRPDSKFWKELAAYKPRHWLLRGPDIVGLSAGQNLEIFEVGRHGIGVMVKNEEEDLVWALQGYVINLAGVAAEQVPSLGEFLRRKGVEDLVNQVATDYQEAKPYGMFDKAHVLLSTLLILPLLGLNVTGWMLTAHSNPGILELCRGLFLFIVCVPIYRFGSSFWGEAFAAHYTYPSFHAIITVCSVAVSMIIPYLFRALGLGIPSTMMMVSSGAMTLIGCSVVQLCWQKRMGRLSKNFWRHLFWGCTVVALSFGVWLLLYAAASVYILLISMQSSFSVIFLPVTTWLLECGTVLGTTAATRMVVFHPRHEGKASAIDGDQRLHVIPCAIACAHGFSEATRLAATVAGAVRTGGTGGITALTLGVFLNLWARSGWGRFSLIWSTSKILNIAPEFVAKRVKPLKVLAPTLFSKLHDEVKVTLGYPRFAVLAALVLSWLLADQLSAIFGTKPMQLPDNWDSALIICGVALAFEITEDMIVLGMDSCLQAPITPKAMEYFQSFECEYPYQCLAVVMRDDYLTATSSPVLHSPSSPESHGGSDNVSRRTSVSSMLRKGPSKVAMDTLAVTHLGPRDSTYSGTLRRRFGQRSVVHHAKGLHGLRRVQVRGCVGHDNDSSHIYAHPLRASSWPQLCLRAVLPAFALG
ncbi:Uncharacterized protein SCF082_LOCUS4874 [Durusdinium trenchii]|uniref:Uncharacterized protein n=1 Tax=Durusdinium trenchii TaxID=1381693 RepID=A0ABP0I213_9DINO